MLKLMIRIEYERFVRAGQYKLARSRPRYTFLPCRLIRDTEYRDQNHMLRTAFNVDIYFVYNVDLLIVFLGSFTQFN